MNTLTELPLAQVHPRADQPRTRFDREPLEELADSIRELGILEPLIVRPAGDGWEIVAGERRWRAAELAGLATVPAVIREDLGDDAHAFRLSMVENVVRADMNPMETARGFGRMRDAGVSVDEIARQTGIAKRKVQSGLTLLDLDALIADLVEKGHVDEWIGTRLATLSANGQHRALKLIREHGLTGQDRDRVIGQVWCEEHETTLFNGNVVQAQPAQDRAAVADLAELAARAAVAAGRVETALETTAPDEQTVELLELMAKSASRIARAARAARVARIVKAG